MINFSVEMYECLQVFMEEVSFEYDCEIEMLVDCVEI